MNNIRYAKSSDVEIIKNIIDEGISINYWSIDDIEYFISDKNNYLLVVVSDTDEPLAVMHCMKGNIKDMCVRENIPYPNKAMEKYDDDTEVVVYKTAATYTNLRNNGYVGSLFEEFDNIFNNIKHDIRIGLALVLPDGTIPIKKLVDKSGFFPTEIFKSPWHKLKSYCSYCNNEYCKCNGLLYIKENFNE